MANCQATFRSQASSLSNNKNYSKEKVEFVLCNKRKVAVKLAKKQNFAVSEALFGML